MCNMCHVCVKSVSCVSMCHVCLSATCVYLQRVSICNVCLSATCVYVQRVSMCNVCLCAMCVMCVYNRLAMCVYLYQRGTHHLMRASLRMPSVSLYINTSLCVYAYEGAYTMFIKVYQGSIHVLCPPLCESLCPRLHKSHKRDVGRHKEKRSGQEVYACDKKEVGTRGVCLRQKRGRDKRCMLAAYTRPPCVTRHTREC